VTVSNEDRDLVNEIVNAITWGPMLSVSTPGPDGDRTINLRASAIVREVKAALIAHGWGPKPTVSAAKIGDIIDEAYGFLVGSSVRGIRDYLRECGIEVTDG
jgi:hypothetical protein